MAKTIIAYEDDAGLREKYKRIFISISQEFKLENIFPNAQKVLEHCDMYKPDAVLMDIQMLDDDDGLIALYLIKQNHPHIKVLVLTMFDTDNKIINAICLKADGYMLKSEFSESRDIAHEAIRKSLRVIFDGGAYLTPAVAKRILELFGEETITEKITSVRQRFKKIVSMITQKKKKHPDFRLTPKQIEVLQKLAEGKSTAEIAAEMGVFESTTNSHIKAIYEILEVNSRTKAVVKAVEAKIIKLKAYSLF
jgi:DNA-binding NarL/FixJ family response regulator